MHPFFNAFVERMLQSSKGKLLASRNFDDAQALYEDLMARDPYRLEVCMCVCVRVRARTSMLTSFWQRGLERDSYATLNCPLNLVWKCLRACPCCDDVLVVAGGLDVYSNILFVKEAAAPLSALAHRVVSTDKYRAETCAVVGNYYSLKDGLKAACASGSEILLEFLPPLANQQQVKLLIAKWERFSLLQIAC
eukprot:1161280-Pelagomonas_calceolata.AAC.9